ncbi:MAG: D-alanyl-D-alanine carboxypeptidase family protein [Micrococcales bacterium]
MVKPKRENSSNSKNTIRALGISTLFVIGLSSVFGNSIAWAAGETPSPTTSPSSSPTGTPTVSPTPVPTGTPTPSPTNSPTPEPTPTVIPRPNIQSAGSLLVVVNKQRPLNPKTYAPKPLAYVNGIPLYKDAAIALQQMAAGMKKAGAGTLWLNSGYRSYATQVAVHDRQVRTLGLDAGERLAARPGYSEHQTGLAADVSALGQGCVIQVCFAKTRAGKWLAANSWQYGWILRYQDGQTSTTGYQFEPWHFRFVGVELATDYKSKQSKSLEAYWGLPPAPKY